MNRKLFHAGLWVNLGAMVFNTVLMVINAIESSYTWVVVHGMLFVLATVISFMMLRINLRSAVRRTSRGASSIGRAADF